MIEPGKHDITIYQGATFKLDLQYKDGVGNRSLSFSGRKFPGGAAPNIALASGTTDLLAYYVESSTRVSARLVSDLK